MSPVLTLAAAAVFVLPTSAGQASANDDPLAHPAAVKVNRHELAVRTIRRLGGEVTIDPWRTSEKKDRHGAAPVRVRLGRNWKGGSAGLALLKDIEHLTSLYVWDVPLSDEDLVHLKPLTGLEQLHLRSPRVTDEGLAHLQPLVKVRRLVLHAPVSVAGMKHLTGWEKLSYVVLRSPKLARGDKQLRQLLPQVVDW